MKQVGDVKDWGSDWIKAKSLCKNQYEEAFPVEFQYLLWICSNISSSCLKKQLLEVSSIHMDKYLLPFRVSFFPTINKWISYAKKKKEMKKTVNSESDKIVMEF